MFDLPKGYLSYSSWTMWKKDKNAFRKRYYLGEPAFENVETIFGKLIARRIEDGEVIPGVIAPGKAEYRVEVELDHGLIIKGVIDNFNDEDCSIVEYKTGHLSIDGKKPWSRLAVHKHKQLPFYCLLSYIKFGKYNEKVILQWLETRFKSKSIMMDGFELKTQTRDLELTGRVETFERVIEQWEVDAILKDIYKVAEEITNDYTIWKKEQTSAK